MPDDAPSVLIADHVASLRAVVDWLDDHPAFASLVTHSTIAAHLDDPALFGAAVRHLGSDAERRERAEKAEALHVIGATRIWATLPLARLPLVGTGEMRQVMARAWPK